ncbi:MAG: HEAT repeat domain-containing protein [Candidatus Delongbacteria bacterium]|nr:HEAT repeat domain-containing protein [Candidatus Delongbacteria bacterium]
MKDMKEKIFDLVFDEIDNAEEVKSIFETIETDQELKDYYKKLKIEKDMLKNDTFVQASDNLLAKNRIELLDSISKVQISASQTQKNSINFAVIFNTYGRNFIKYAAVILLTFYATMYHFNINKKEPQIISTAGGFNGNATPYRTVAVESGKNIYNGIDMSKYKVENLSIDESENEIAINFDVSTNKIIKGAKNDPAIINTLKYLMEHENNSGVKYKTMKAIDISDDASFKETLLKVMTSDKDPLIRRKAMKMVSSKTKDEAVREALFQVVLSDTDQTNRIEALGILERIDEKYADKALKSVSAESNEYFRFKAEEMNENKAKGQ